MVRNAILGLLYLGTLSAFSENCPDGQCSLSSAEREPLALAAAPSVNVRPIAQGRRLSALNGKTLALVGGSFMASITHPELKRLVLGEFPDAEHPRNWDELMRERGYRPLSDFYLKSDVRPDVPKVRPQSYSRPAVRGDVSDRRTERSDEQDEFRRRPGARRKGYRRRFDRSANGEIE